MNTTTWFAVRHISNGYVALYAYTIGAAWIGVFFIRIAVHGAEVPVA